MLAKLSLRNNHLLRFPGELTKLKGLEDIDLENNSLSSLPYNFAFSSLKSLNLSNNQLMELPTSISKYVIQIESILRLLTELRH